MPECPGPIQVCQSIGFAVVTAGYKQTLLSSDSSSDLSPEFSLHLSQRTGTSYSGANLTTNVYAKTDGGTVILEDYPYEREIVSGTLLREVVEEWSQGWSASVIQCGASSTSEESTRCEVAGSFSEEERVGYVYGSPQERKIVTTLTREFTYEDVGGDLNPAYAEWEDEFAQWELDHSDWESDHAQWVIDLASYDEGYQEAYDDWVDGGMVGDEPDYNPPNEPEEPAEPNEPVEFWPPCTTKTTISSTLYDVSFVDGEPFSEPSESTEEEPNPFVQEFFGSPVRPRSSSTEIETEFGEAVSPIEQLALGLEWARNQMNWDGVSDSGGSNPCEYEGFCTARFSESVDDWSGLIVGQDIRYGWCVPDDHYGSYYRIEWDEVSFPDGWDDSQDSTPPEPQITPKSWEWTGPPTHPSESSGSDSFSLSLSESSSDERCSPWSPVVRVPEGMDGVTEVRNVRVLCYRSALGEKFQIYPNFGIYVESDQSSG
jgi:hypothetical protein